MSPKQKFVFVVVVLACAVALLWWRSWNLSSAPGVERQLATELNASSAPASALSEGSGPAANETRAKSAEPPPTQKPSPELRRTFETLNHNEIEFYGRALDQFGEPVPAADVEGVVIVNTGTRGGEAQRRTTTDAQGYFQLGGFKGQDLGIALRKIGYEYSRQNSSFSYSYFEADHKRHIPDPKNPVIFVLWKKQGSEPLVNYSKTFWEIPASGTPVKIDLATGQLGGPKADLIVTLERTPLRMRFGERGYPWKVTIDVVGGGLVRAGQRDYYNLAPETGYEPRLEHVQAAQSVRYAQEGQIKWSWQDSVSEEIFVKSLDGTRYARVQLRIHANGRDDNDTIGSVGMTVWLNPNGSRNLEFDPAKLIAVPR